MKVADFQRHDLIVAMDRLNREVLLDLSPAAYRERVRLLMEFAGVPLDDGEQLDVPDPYYGGAVGFERVLDLVEQAADGLLAEIRARMRRIDRGSDAGRNIPSGIAANPRQGSPTGPSRVASLGGDGVQSLRGGAGVSEGTGCAGADAACGGGSGRPKSGAGPRGRFHRRRARLVTGRRLRTRRDRFGTGIGMRAVAV